MRRLALALLLIASAPADVLPRQLPPVDQCATDAGFTRFRTELGTIVAKRDRGALLALLAPDVLVDFGGGTGRTAFERDWTFDPAEYGNVWSQLDKMLKMGCARDGGSRIIPSLPMQVEQDFDEEWVVVLPGGKIFKAVGEEAAHSAILPWTVATVTGRDSDTMTAVKLPDGRDGLVSDDLLYEPVGYRMIVEKRGGKWLITAFVGGD